MNYVITGSLGNISRPVIKSLISAGHQVTVITSDSNKVADIASLGAKAAVGSVQDAAFVKLAFAGADAVYTMVPPFWITKDWKKDIGTVGENYAAAIEANGIKYVVNLSSIGAHMAEGCGPVSGLHRVETALNMLLDVNIKHIRPGYFYNNFLAQIDMIKQVGIMGGNFGTDARLFLADTGDIAQVVAEELLELDFKGHSVRYIISDDSTPGKIAAAFGAAIDKPDLPWTEFTDEQSTTGMIQAGLPEEIAVNYTEMGSAIHSGKMVEDYISKKLQPTGGVKLADFVQVFAAAYKG